MSYLHQESSQLSTHQPLNGGFLLSKQVESDSSSIFHANAEDKHTQSTKGKTFDIFLSVLSQVVISDEDEEEEWSVISKKSTFDADDSFRAEEEDKVSQRLERSSQNSNIRSAVVPMEEEHAEEYNGAAPSRQQEEYDDEIPEDPLPDFLDKVDALSRLSVSAPTLALSRSRAGGRRRSSRGPTLSRYNSPSQIESGLPSLSTSTCGNNRSLRCTTRGQSGDASPSLPIREARSFPTNSCMRQHRQEQEQQQRRLPRRSTSKGQDLSPRDRKSVV